MGNLSDVMGETMSKVKEMVDVNTIVGNPITVPDGTTLIPVSKVMFGFASGGSDTANQSLRIGAGSGAGVTITPVAFIVISNGNVRMIYMDPPANTTVDRIIDMVPGVIDKVKEFTGKKTEDKKPESQETVY